MRRRLHDRTDHGFTLIELLVVIIILGILAAVVVFAVSGVGDKGKSSATRIDERTLRTAEEAYCAKNGTYASGADLVAGGFLSEVPEYHEINAQQTTSPGSGNCNGWKYFVTRTDQASPYGVGSWDPVSSPDMFVDAMVRLPDGRVFARGYNMDFDTPMAKIFDPVGDSWTLQDTPPSVNFGTGAVDVLLAEDSATPYSECSGAVDNCGKILSFARYLFDPRVAPGTTGQWQTLSGPSVSTCAVCFLGPPGSRNNFAWVQIKGTPAQCGANCGNIAFFPDIGGPNTGNYDLLDPRTNAFQTFAYPTGSFITAAEMNTRFNYGGVAQLPDGTLFACCSSGGGPSDPPISMFMNIATALPTDTPTITQGPVPPLAFGRAADETSPISPLPNGDLYLSGETSHGVTQTSVGMYSPSTGTFTVAPRCPTADSLMRCERVASLPDGRILAGPYMNSVNFGGGREAYLFNPATKSWSRVADYQSEFTGYRDALYLDPAGGPCGAYCGKVLLAGYGSAELFTP